MSELMPADFDFVRALVQRRSAIVLDDGKEYLVAARLLPLARRHSEGSLPGLVAELRRDSDAALQTAVVEAMTTNETSWFRDQHPYDAFETIVLPRMLQERRVERRLRVWSAACSSGQEAYTLGMLVAERLGQDRSWDVSIVATDLSREMVARTRAGRYGAVEVNRGLPAARLVRHFARTGTEWQVSDALLALVDARQMNLAEPFPPLPAMDVVFLRNVLIYFDLATKRAVLDRVAAVLRPDGWLFLGGAESTLGVHDGFERVPLERATAYRLRQPGGGGR